MAEIISINELLDQIEKGLADPLFNVTISGQQRLYIKTKKGSMNEPNRFKIAYAVVV